MEAWLARVSSTLRTVVKKNRRLLVGRPTVGMLSFEMGGIMSKLLHLWQCLSDKQITRLRRDVINQEGVRKIVSNDDAFLMGLACAEIVDGLRHAAAAVGHFARRSTDPALRKFNRNFWEFSEGRDGDSNWWVLPPKEMDGKVKKASRLVVQTARLYKEMEAVAELESALRRLEVAGGSEKKAMDLREKFDRAKQEIGFLKDGSLWSRNYDSTVLLLARLVFTVVVRVKLVFRQGDGVPSPVLPRSSSVSSAVYPSSESIATTSVNHMSGLLRPTMESWFEDDEAAQPSGSDGLFETCKKLLGPPASTLGSAALALHYANLIIVLEKMSQTPHLIGSDARDDLYAMLPASIRASLRTRLRAYCRDSASDPALAEKWVEAIRQILDWLSPLAQNMIRWQTERNFEQRRLISDTDVLLPQTLFFANQAKTEAAITELLVGLNYIWRYDRDLNAMAFLDSNTLDVSFPTI